MGSFVGYVSLTTDVTEANSEMYLASGANLSRSEHHSLSSFCLLSPYLTAVLTDVAPMSEKLAVKECEKASIMTTDWR
jgi:hypothetical protein